MKKPKKTAKRNFRKLTRDELASFYHVTVRTVDRWITDECPRHADGTFDPAKVFQWRLDRAVADGSLNLNAERAKLARAQTEKAELDLAERRGELIDLQVARREIRAICSAARDRLMGLPERLAPVIVGIVSVPEMFSRLTLATNEALDSIQIKEFLNDAE